MNSVYIVWARFEADEELVWVNVYAAETREVAEALVQDVERIREILTNAWNRQHDDVEDENFMSWDEFDEITERYNDLFSGYAADIACSGYFETYHDQIAIVKEVPQQESVI